MESLRENKGATRYVPLSEQYALTVEEAAVYFRIGENKLRCIISNNDTANYILRVGARTLIKRRLFEEFLDKVNEV